MTVSRKKRYAPIIIYAVLSTALVAMVILGCFLEVLPVSRTQAFAGAVVLGLFLLRAILEEAEHHLARAAAFAILSGGSATVVVAGYFFELFPVTGREAGAAAIIAAYFFLMTLAEALERKVLPTWLGLTLLVSSLLLYFAVAFIIAAARAGSL